MPSLTIHGIPDDLFERLRRSAEKNRRSLNSEVLYHLQRSFGGSAVDPNAFLTRIRQLRERTNPPPLTEALLEQARRADRP